MLQNKIMLIKVLFSLGIALLIAATANPVRAQAFAELKSALVDYSKAEIEPDKACEVLSTYKSKEIVQITASTMPASDEVPAHCRVTGLLSPEVAFEVSLPAKWNGRFYMIGNGGHAGEALNDPGRVTQRNEALKLGFAFAQTNTGHDSSKEPGAIFVLSPRRKRSIMPTVRCTLQQLPLRTLQTITTTSPFPTPTGILAPMADVKA